MSREDPIVSRWGLMYAMIALALAAVSMVEYAFFRDVPAAVMGGFGSLVASFLAIAFIRRDERDRTIAELRRELARLRRGARG